MRVARCFLNADLRQGHTGLAKLAAQSGIDVNRLGHGEFLVFINASRNRIKVYAESQVIAYLRMEKGTVDLNTVQHIPKAFGGGRIDYDKALRHRLATNLVERPKPGPLRVLKAQVRDARAP